MNQSLLRTCAICEKSRLGAVAESGNCQLLANTFDHTPVDRAFDCRHITPAVASYYRCQILLIDKRGGLLNLRNRATGIVTVQYHNSQLGGSGYAGSRIRAAQLNGNQGGDFLPHFLLEPLDSPHHALGFINVRIIQIIGGLHIPLSGLIRAGQRAHQERAA